MRRKIAFVVILALLVVLGGTVLFACSQTPTSVPVRTFERAQRVDVVCLRVFDPVTGEPIVPVPVRQEECAPVPPNVNGGGFVHQLFALVTQSARGEVAVVDLSAGFIVDQNRAVPGINFLPVGALPTDVATTPDGRMAFVASAEPNKFAIYGIPSRRILGDIEGRPADPEGAPTLASWPVCALPQRPGALAIVPRPQAAAPAGDGGADAGVAPPPASTDVPIEYELVAILPGERSASAKLLTIDPKPFLRGAPPRNPDGSPAETYGPGPEIPPGSLLPCPITAAIELVGEAGLPPSVPEGPTWDDGLPYVDGGVDLTCFTPPKPASCGLPPCRCVAAPPPPRDEDAGPDAEAGVPPPPAACEADASAPVRNVDLDFGPLEEPHLVAVARDYQTLFVADEGVPLIHVVDLSEPGNPRELPPYVASSIVDPSRVVAVRDVALSPPTRDYKRYLYAVDRKQGSIMVFDATDPATAPRMPLTRPHAELNPFQPPDRIAFAAPIVAVTFARHDFPLATIDRVPQASAASGVVCNPNPNANPVGGGIARDLGFYYRFDSPDQGVNLGPFRLRGVFGFATLSSGSVVAIDVDDWDAPCRRPENLTTAGHSVPESVLAAPQPAPANADDLDPYHAPEGQGVTNERFFPVSAPHRARSQLLLRDDQLSRRSIPTLTAPPAGRTPTGETVPQTDTSGLFATAPTPASTVGGVPERGVRFSFDVPEVHIDQDWTVTFEGALPGFDGLAATMDTPDGYASLVLSQPQARFCAKGVEDWTVGSERAAQILAALAAAQQPLPKDALDRRMFDYVQIADELLPPDDPYWSLPDDPGACWGGLPPGRPRFDACWEVFGSVGENRPTRDLPIVEAYDDRLVVSRFYEPPGATREIVYKDPSNARQLELVRCCFHHQASFRIRAASQWVTVGQIVGFLNHVARGTDGRCVLSCDPRQQLLNGRAPMLPDGITLVPYRDSPLAMRNPMFSFFAKTGPLRPARDTTWAFRTAGQFQPLVISLTGPTTTTAVNPQSMRFIESLGQIAVVDAASQGLVLIHLGGVTVARAPYF